jgi:ribosomal protein S18 acetylase RimI-like enzyme
MVVPIGQREKALLSLDGPPFFSLHVPPGKSGTDTRPTVELYHSASYTPPVSVNVERREIEQGDADLLDTAWDLKERVRERDGVLKQRRRFFDRAYERATVYAYRDPERAELIGFAATRGDGYVLFLVVAPEYRGEGFGEALIARVAEDHDRVTCHARTTNDEALSFYQHLGFETIRRIDNYYEDGGDAHYLRLGDSAGLVERLSALFRR